MWRQVPNTTGWIEPEEELSAEELEAGKKPRKRRAKKTRDMELWGLWGEGVVSPLQPEVHPQASWTPVQSTVCVRVCEGGRSSICMCSICCLCACEGG